MRKSNVAYASLEGHDMSTVNPIQFVWVFRFDGWGLPFGSRLDHPLVGVAVTHAPTAGSSVAG